MEQVLRHWLHVFLSGKSPLGRGWQFQGFCPQMCSLPRHLFQFVFCSSKFTFKISIPFYYCLKASSSCINRKCLVFSSIHSWKLSTLKLPLVTLPKSLLWILTTLAFSLELEGGFLYQNCVLIWLTEVHFESFIIYHTGKCSWLLMHPTSSCEHKSRNREQMDDCLKS